MAQAKRGPKAKPKVPLQEVTEQEVSGNPSTFISGQMPWPDYHEQRVWELSRDLLLNRARTASPITPVAIVELVSWAKLLDREVGG